MSIPDKITGRAKKAAGDLAVEEKAQDVADLERRT
jgi:hypothetical protein